MPDLILEATGIDVSELISRYAEGREDPPLVELFALHGITLKAKDTQKEPSLDVRFKQSQGELHLATVYEHGAAHVAGLSAGDVLVAVDGLRVQTQAQLEQQLATYLVGKTVPVHVFRRDELRSYSVTLTPSIQKQFEFTDCHESN